MSVISRSEILRIFKALHRTRQKTFCNDIERLEALRQGINEHFKNSKSETDPEKIKQLYSDAVTIEDELRTKIIQIEEIEPGYHKLNLTADHCVEDNAVFFAKNKFKTQTKDTKCQTS